MRVRSGDVAITPLAVVEDSRCPANVQCIQAGTVRIAARVQSSGARRNATIGLTAPYQLEGEWVHLVAVCPYPRYPVAHGPTAYRFTFLVNQGPKAPDYARPCQPR